MNLNVEIDPGAGFCGGVIRAISRAEQYLDAEGHDHLYSLGAIVHNEEELARLGAKGLITLGTDDLHPGRDTLLIRAHGEPPSTYRKASGMGYEIIDCTCPVVLQLQRRIKDAYQRLGGDGKVLIFGKIGHAEVLGLLGQVDGDALVFESLAMLESMIEDGSIDLRLPVEIFSQTTKSPEEYSEICDYLRSRGTDVRVHDTICHQVATRHSALEAFSRSHDVILFVSGRQSSNGLVLYKLCKGVNPRTYLISSTEEIIPEWFRPGDKVGISGATSTPKWLLDDVASRIRG